MSNKPIDKDVWWHVGLKGPLRPTPLEGLHRLFASLKMGNDTNMLRRILQTTPGYRQPLHRALTSNHQEWLGAAEFHVKSGKVWVLFPLSDDDKKHDGTATDSEIAMYADPAVIAFDTEGLTALLCSSFRLYVKNNHLAVG